MPEMKEITVSFAITVDLNEQDAELEKECKDNARSAQDSIVYYLRGRYPELTVVLSPPEVKGL